MNDMARPRPDREIATTADGIDITRGYTGPLLTPLDSVLRTRGGNDLQIYEQVYSDAEVKSTFAQRQLAVTQYEWQVDAGGDRRVDKQAAEFLRQQLHKVGWDRVTTLMLNGIFYGHAVSEVIYGREGERVTLSAIKVRNRRRFRYSKEGELRLLTRDNMFEGIPAPEPYFWRYATGADHDDEPYGLGLAHWLYWPVLFKRNGIKFWLIFLEKFGMPTAVGEYDEEATGPEKAKLLQATRAIQTDSGIIVPKGMVLKLLEAGRSGTADYKTLYDTMNETIQKVVLGQTASTQGTAGKLGNDDLQADVRADIIKADADLICESFNLGPATWLTRWNFPTAELPRVYRVTEEPEDLTARAERDGKVAELGFKPTLHYVQETYGGEWEPKDPPPQTGTEDPAASAIAEAEFADAGRTVVDLLRRHGVTFADPGADGDPPEQMVGQLARGVAPAGQKWLEQIQQLVERAESLDELREQLLELAPDMDLDAYTSAMATALTAAHLAGRYELLEELQGGGS